MAAGFSRKAAAKQSSSNRNIRKLNANGLLVRDRIAAAASRICAGVS